MIDRECFLFREINLLICIVVTRVFVLLYSGHSTNPSALVALSI